MTPSDQERSDGDRSDRRAFIRRAGAGAAIAGGAWIAPAILSVDSAGAAGTCIPRSYQIDATTCTQDTTDTTELEDGGFGCPYHVPLTCLPDGWESGSTYPPGITSPDPFPLSCDNGLTITFAPGCYAVEAWGVQFCPDNSGCDLETGSPCDSSCWDCEPGVISNGGQTVTFPALPPSSNCVYLTYRIQLCCID